MNHNIPIEPPERVLKHIRKYYFLAEVDGRLRLFTARGMREIGSVSNGSEIHDGYSRLTIKGRTVKRSHVCFYLFNGRWPELQLDHNDDDKMNDDPRNLREVTDAQNQAKRWGRAA